MTLLAQWKLQDSAANGTVVATVGSNANLQNANTNDIDVAGPGTLLTSGLDFGAANVYINLGNTSITQNKSILTVCGFFKADTANSGTKYIFNSNTGAGAGRLLIYMSSTGFLNVQARAGDAESDQVKTTSAEYDDGNWHHLAVVVNYAADTITIYIDGSSVSSTGTISFTASATGNTASSANYLATAGFAEFTGALADWRVYDSDESANLATIIAEKDADSTPPLLSSAVLGTDGETLTLTFDENVVVANALGLTFTPSGAAATLTYSSGSGTDTIEFTTSRTILEDETLTLAYSSTTGDIEDTIGNDLATFAAIDVGNASAQEEDGLGPDPVPPETFSTAYSLPVGGTTYEPTDSAALTTALAAAVGGDVIVLTAGVTYTGNFKLRDWGAGTDWIYIISSAMASLPAEGTRVDLDDIANMPTITATTNAPIHSDFGAHHYRLAGLRIVTSTTSDRLATIQFGYDGDFTVNATSLDEMVQHITIDRCVIGSTQNDYRLRHGVMLNVIYGAVVDSYIYNCKDSADAQAIFIHNSPGPFKVVNCFLEATGENIIVGGSDTTITGLVPSDLEFTGNYLFKRLDWLNIANSWTIKNLFELKNVRRVLCSGNVMENNWPDGQNGTAVLFTVRNQVGDYDNPWSVIKDVEFSNNIVTNTSLAFNITGEDDLHESAQTKRIKIHNNLVDVTGLLSAQPTFFQTGTGGLPIVDLTVTHNTCWMPEGIDGLDIDGTFAAFNFAYDGTNVDNLVCHSNIMMHGYYNANWARTSPTLHENNVWVMESVQGAQYDFMVDNFATNNPGDMMADPDLDSVGFTDWENGDWRLDELSDFYQQGTGGTDPGIDQDELEEETFGAVTGVWVAPPVNTAAPAISIFPYNTETISTTNGSWDNDPTSYTYQWRLADDGSGTGAADIVGETSSSLDLNGTYWGKYVRCVVTATNDEGSTSANATLFGSTWVYVFAPVAREEATYLEGEWDDFGSEDGVDLFNETIGDLPNDLIPFPLTFNASLAAKFRAPWFCVASEFNGEVGRETDAVGGCGATLISPRHVLMVQHCKPSAVYFKQTDGTEVYREIEWADWIHEDLAVGRLDSEVTTIDPVAVMAGGALLVGRDVALLEAGRFLSTTEIIVNSEFFYTSTIEGESGDSGHPVFAINGNQSILVGLMTSSGHGHSASDNIDRINAVLGLYDESLTLVTLPIGAGSGPATSPAINSTASPTNPPLVLFGA